MRTFGSVLLLLFVSCADAAVINFEFKFTPFVGDPATAEEVQSVPGTARVFINNVPIAEQPVAADKLPVMFEEREIAPSVWLPIASAGSSVRKGANTLRIEFEPEDAALAYRAQLRWAAVNDETYEEQAPGTGTSTNQSNEGVDEKSGPGKLVMERAFDAAFATDQPWHHYPPTTSLSDADRAALARLLADRAALFEPGFEKIYAILAGTQMPLDEVKKLDCLGKIHAAGLRMAAPGTDELDITLTGNAEVVLARKGGTELFQPTDPSVIDKVSDEQVQMCAGFALMSVYPPRLIVVRNPAGSWEVVN